MSKDESYPYPTSVAASTVMRANRKTGTKPEALVRSALHQVGFRFHVDTASRLATACPCRGRAGAGDQGAAPRQDAHIKPEQAISRFSRSVPTPAGRSKASHRSSRSRHRCLTYLMVSLNRGGVHPSASPVSATFARPAVVSITAANRQMPCDVLRESSSPPRTRDAMPSWPRRGQPPLGDGCRSQGAP